MLFDIVNMATSTMRRCLLKVSRRLARQNTVVQERSGLHTGCMLSKAKTENSSSSTSSTSAETAAPDNLIRDSLQPKTVTKAQKISRAMQAYMERAQSYEKMIKQEIDEYDIGKRHLANIMGQDPDLFEQEDVDRAIEYLLPSGITDKRARPILKHPYEVFPRRKAAQFGLDGRPFHSMFYTGKHNFYSLLLNVSLKLEELKREEDGLLKKGQLHDEADKKLTLHGSSWITLQNLKDLTLEPVTEHDLKHMMVLMDRLAEHPLAYKEEEFIMKYRRKLMVQSLTQDIPKPLIDENGRAYITAVGQRKTAKAEVTLWSKGTGEFTINGKGIQYFTYITLREQVLSPLQFTGHLGEMDVVATVQGGGAAGQSGAVRLALSKALASFVDEDTREKMRIAGLLTKDFRRRERKKPGQKKARKKFTWKKR